jgi:RND family efflux transporter MFP subunit
MKEISVLFLLIILSLSGCKTKTTLFTGEEVIKVRTTIVRVDTLSIPVHSTGVLTSDQEIKLSFKTGGIIEKIPVNEGDQVKKGDLLASLNLSEINAQVTQAKNSYDKAMRDFSRAQNLFKDSVVTLEQFQNASTALNVAMSNFEIAEYNLTHSIITAPENGVILKQLFKTNELVGSGFPVFLFGASGKSWKLKAGFPDKDIIKINRGDSVKVTIDAWPEVKFRGVVTQVGEMSNPLTGTYEAEISVKNAGYRFISGFVAGVEVYPSMAESYLTVPVQSLVEADGKSGYIYSVTSESRVRKIKVEIVTLIGSSVAITGVASDVAAVVTDGAAYLRDGVKVEVIK